jgi:hypothetical protein
MEHKEQILRPRLGFYYKIKISYSIMINTYIVI